MALPTPDPPTLLETARRLLLDELLLALPADKRHAALMIANAMAIADRQHAGGAPAPDELDALAALLPAASSAETEGPASPPAPTTLNRTLCHLIREGWADRGARHDQVLGLLWRVARRQVEQSNPKYLSSMLARQDR
jgi:Domain of unknown function (DUF6285)